MGTFQKISKQAKAEIAIQLVIMDAIEKGHTDTAEIVEYMKSETFFKSVAEYISLMESATV